MKRLQAKDVDSYIAAADMAARPILNELRQLVKATVPEVKEVISWGVPIYKYHGVLAGFALTIFNTVAVLIAVISDYDGQLGGFSSLFEYPAHFFPVPGIMDVFKIFLISAQDGFKDAFRDYLSSGSSGYPVVKQEYFNGRFPLQGLQKTQMPGCDKGKIAADRPGVMLACQVSAHRQRNAAPQVGGNVDAVVRFAGEQGGDADISGYQRAAHLPEYIEQQAVPFHRCFPAVRYGLGYLRYLRWQQGCPFLALLFQVQIASLIGTEKRAEYLLRNSSFILLLTGCDLPLLRCCGTVQLARFD